MEALNLSKKDAQQAIKHTRPVLVLTKTIGEPDARVEVTNYYISNNEENQKNNMEILEREINLMTQAAKQLNQLTTKETSE